MPGQTQQSSVLAKFQARINAAHEKVKDLPPANDFGGQAPPGIELGIAKLTDAHFGEYKSGKYQGHPFFMARAAIQSPKVFKGMPLFGSPTKIGPIPLCGNGGTGKLGTADGAWKFVLDTVTALGLEGVEEMSGTDVEDALPSLVAAAPTFKFRTWAGEKTKAENRGGKWFVVGEESGKLQGQNPGPFASEQALKAANPYVGRDPIVNEVWGARVDVEANGDMDQVTDETGGQPEASANGDEGTPEPESQTGGEVEVSEELAGLAEAAEGGDKKARVELVKRAKATGLSEDQIEDENLFPDWAALVVHINQAEVGGEEPAEEEQEEEEAYVPTKGANVWYKPMGANGKRLKQVQCEVTSVLAKSEKVNLKNLATKKEYKGIGWDEVEPVS